MQICRDIVLIRVSPNYIYACLDPLPNPVLLDFPALKASFFMGFVTFQKKLRHCSQNNVTRKDWKLQRFTLLIGTNTSFLAIWTISRGSGVTMIAYSQNCWILYSVSIAVILTLAAASLHLVTSHCVYKIWGKKIMISSRRLWNF